MIIAVDYDETVVRSGGRPVPHALDALRQLQERGHRILVWTCRDSLGTQVAVEYLQDNGIKVWGANRNPVLPGWGSPKVYADIYIDDRGLGCPVVWPDDDGTPYVDWPAVLRWLDDWEARMEAYMRVSP